VDGSNPAKARSLAGLVNLSISPISANIIAAKVYDIPGMLIIGELISVITSFIWRSKASISDWTDWINLIVCCSSKDKDLVLVPIEVLAASFKVIALSLPYLPLEALLKILVSLVRWQLAMSFVLGNSDRRL